MNFNKWVTYKWGELCTLEYGKGLKGYRDSTGKIPVYGTNGPIGFTEKELSNRDGVIIGRKGAYRGVHYSPIPFFVIDTAFYMNIIDQDKLDMKFAYYNLLTKDINSMDSGSAIPSTSRNDFYNLESYIPTLKEQQAIANILSTLDEKIETNNQINKKLEEMAQAIFKQWFVDFEFPNENGDPYKSSGGEMIESEMGMIPKGWIISRINDLPIVVTDYVANGSFKSLKDNVSIYDNENYAIFMRNTDLKCNFQSGKKYVDKNSYDFLSKTKLFGGELIISNVGDVGSVYLCPYFSIPMTLGNNVIMINSTGSVSFNYFLYSFFKSREGQGFIDCITGGSAQPKFNKTDFRNLKLMIPGEGILIIYNNIIGVVEEKIMDNRNENDRLLILRDNLLPKLMSGEIRVQIDN